MYTSEHRRALLLGVLGCVLFGFGARPAPAQTLTCPGSPSGGCIGPVAERGSRLNIHYDGLNPRRSRLEWRVKNAATTFVTQFGDPASGTTEYAVCVYSGGSLVYGGDVPAQGTCKGQNPCWSGDVEGYRYRDPGAFEEGLTRISVRQGVEGRARVFVRASNNIVTPTFDTALTPPPYANQVTAQIINDAGQCWEAKFDNGILPFARNDAVRFRATAIGP